MPNFPRALLKTAVLAAALTLLVVNAFAADVYLKAQGLTKPLPGGAFVPMWGFASCTDATFATCQAPSVPGPQIAANAGETLALHVKNDLPTPISLVIPGQAGGGDPTWMFDSQGRRRVQSFTQEVPSLGTRTYTFSSVRAGTFLYQSGTLSSIQVPMGLYGALVVQQAPSQAYGRAFNSEVVLLLSEIDEDQNTATAAAGAAVAAYPSVVNYNPKYYLINGVAFDKAAIAASTFPAGTPAPGATEWKVLLRYLNAGLHSHSAVPLGLNMELLGEEGNAYPEKRVQATVHVGAGKALDALVTVLPQADGSFNVTYPIYDRMLNLSNNLQPEGGMLAYLKVGSGSAPVLPPAVGAAPDAYNVTEDVVLSVAAPGVLTNDTGVSTPTLVSPPANGAVTLNADGSFSYTPNANYSGNDAFTYGVVDAGNNSYTAAVTLSVSFANDAPLAANDAYSNVAGGTITIAKPGVLGNDSDADGDALTATLVSGPVALNPDGSFTFTSAPGNYSFTYLANDGKGGTTQATVALTIKPPSNIALNVRGNENPGVAITSYRYVVEEDVTWRAARPPAPASAEVLGNNFHKSYMPVVAQGCVGAAPFCANSVPFSQLALDPAKYYYVSVLPADATADPGHTLGGASLAPGAAALDVICNRTPTPTAQIHVFIFEDNNPTNGVPDLGEVGLGGFQISVEDPAGAYGMGAGQQSQDVFGQMLKNALNCAPAPSQPGIILTCDNGDALIQNLAPGKFGITAVPPANSPVRWIQTSTIEGTKVIDAWVKANEPAFFQEFGPPGPHVFIGYVSPDRLPAVAGANSVSGRVTNLHMSRPPVQSLWNSQSREALAHTTAYVGLNSAGGLGATIKVLKANADGTFNITGVPDGSYQLVVWDEFLDQIIAYRQVTLPGGGVLNDVPVFNWFARLENNVFLDGNQNGIRDLGEAGLFEQAVNLRWRDGSMYMSNVTDMEGYLPFDEAFPFFHWLVAEVDYARYKPTGVTVTVDHGGDVATAPAPFTGVLNPQVQLDGSLSRTEVGPQLLQAFQGFLGQTSVIDWGKAPYLPGENGGISGIVYYASTRAEFNPRLAAGLVWEPGIPRVTVRLYREVATAPAVLGGPYGKSWALVAEAQTDSWDDNLPAGCPGEAYNPANPTDPATIFVNQTLGGNPTKCYDGIRVFNQIRPGVFDGGYAFGDLKPGKYMVEVVPPPGYELVKEEDINVGFGEAFVPPVPLVLPNLALVTVMPDRAMIGDTLLPEAGILQPPCVGEQRPVPAELSLFPGEAAPYASVPKPLCNRKEVILSDQSQAAADFFLFTSTPVAGHFAGMILDDMSQEFNPASPQFGEKFALPFLPVSVRDWTGREISRIYSDQWGRMNGLVPSTFNANIPNPSGYSPNMITTCMNDPSLRLPNGSVTADPLHNPMYSNFCYTFQYMPGKTTYLDTPVVPTAAFASGYNPVDCAYANGTPVIKQVDGYGGPGPFLNPTAGVTGRTLTIYASGPTTVPNPDYDGPTANPPFNQSTITRDFGFGNSQGRGNVTIGGRLLTITGWTNTQITAVAPTNVTTGQLVVTRDNLKKTVAGLTVHVGNETPVRVSASTDPNARPIQDAIDLPSTLPGSLILVGPGEFNELVLMWKPVRLQGVGAASIVNARKTPAEKLQAWRTRLNQIVQQGLVDLAPGQAGPVIGEPEVGVAPPMLATEEGAGITVLAKNDGSFLSFPSLIDGFTVTSGDTGGGIFVNAWAHRLEISNNRITGNSGQYHGGLRIGHPYLPGVQDGTLGSGPFGFNRQVNIHHNAITLNGGLMAAGGGLALCTGSDNYQVNYNFICGNFSSGDGGGIGHLGLSDNGVISNNQVVFNQTFNQGVNVSGGGIFIGGEPPAAPAPNAPPALPLGSGDVTINANLIQGNQAGAGHGGGIRTQFINGAEVALNPTLPDTWYRPTITNNMIVNNMAGWSGAGISLQDTARALVSNNTVVDNDSTATVGAVFTVGPNTSVKQPAGISAERHSPALVAASGQAFSNPKLVNNIVWHNRSFHYDGSGGTAGLVPALTPTTVGACPAGAFYWDLGIVGDTSPTPNPAMKLNPIYSILGSVTGYATTNVATTPPLRTPYCNGPRTMRLVQAPTTLLPLPALDEGGNWIDVRWGPLTLMGDYHIRALTTAGTTADAPNTDFDGQTRLVPYDRGADEYEVVRIAPTSLIATSIQRTSVSLSWNDNSNNESGFIIERAPAPTAIPATGDPSWVEVGRTATNVRIFTNTGLTPNTYYAYRVRGYTPDGISVPSNAIRVLTLP